MSENLRKLIGVAVMAAIVVVGVVATNGDDFDSSRTRNGVFVKLGDIKGDFKDDGGGKNEEIVFESKRRNVLALGGDSVASVIVGDNHFRDVGDPTSALKKLADTAEPLVGEDKGLGVRGPLSKLVDTEFPTFAIQTDDGLTLGPLGGEGVFISFEDDLLKNVDASDYTETEWTFLQKSLLEASENLQAIARELGVLTSGGTTK